MALFQFFEIFLIILSVPYGLKYGKKISYFLRLSQGRIRETSPPSFESAQFYKKYLKRYNVKKLI